MHLEILNVQTLFCICIDEYMSVINWPIPKRQRVRSCNTRFQNFCILSHRWYNFVYHLRPSFMFFFSLILPSQIPFILAPRKAHPVYQWIRASGHARSNVMLHSPSTPPWIEPIFFEFIDIKRKWNVSVAKKIFSSYILSILWWFFLHFFSWILIEWTAWIKVKCVIDDKGLYIFVTHYTDEL